MSPKPAPRTRGKQVRLNIFDNEPMARMAEQRLRSEGIPAMVRSLHGGPGLWGSAFNLPHGLYVFQSDVTTARDVLGIAPPDPLESSDMEGSPSRRTPFGLIVAVAAIVIALTLTAPAWTALFS
jgi:hypothetical protein